MPTPLSHTRILILLSFNNVKVNLLIPFESIISFADPNANFGLKLIAESNNIKSATSIKLSLINIINDNLEVFKRLGRVSDVSHAELNKNGVKIIVGGETIILYFDQNLDLQEQKQKILNKVKYLNQQINRISEKMKNKSFLKNAPKQIVDNEKKTLIDCKFELKKLNSILNSIKN